ncbi:MAG: hypothetical protein AB7L09_01855 [Nitrospira sp.]
MSTITIKRGGNRAENANGLTYSEWHAAATFGVKGKPPTSETTLRAAWREGEDPTDWAAYHAVLALRS